MITFIKKNKFNLIVFFIYFLITMLTAFHHELWRDETQVWCIVREASLSQALAEISVEGHPILWYVFVFPLAKVGLSVQSMQVLSLLLMYIATILLLFCSPFDKFSKFSITFSAGFLYWLPIVSRNYCLIPLFIFLLAKIYPKREEHPYWYAITLILLCNTHILMFMFCFTLFLLFMYETIKNFPYQNNTFKKILYFCPCFLLFLNNILLPIFFMNSYKLNSSIFTNSFFQKFYILRDVTNSLGQSYFLTDAFFYNKNLTNITSICFLSFLLIFSILLFRFNRKLFFVYSVSTIYQIYVLANFWSLGATAQKLFLIILVIIFCCWNSISISKNFKKVIIFMNVLLIGSFFQCYCWVLGDILLNFSTSEQLANFLLSQKNIKRYTYIGKQYLITSTVAYCPNKQFYDVITKNLVTYTVYNKNKILTKDIQNTPYSKNQYLIISQEDLKKLNGYEKLNLVFQTKGYNLISPIREKEMFNVYKLY